MSHAGTENGSRGFSADQLEQQVHPPSAKTIISYLNDKITTFLMTDQAAELKQLKIEGDLVTSFFDSVTSLSDSCLYTFIEQLKLDIDLIKHILHNSTNEMIVFFTYILIILKKLNLNKNYYYFQ